jgi:hypothetical protein
MGNNVAGNIFKIIEAHFWYFPGKTDKNYRRLQSSVRGTNRGIPEQGA